MTTPLPRPSQIQKMALGPNTASTELLGVVSSAFYNQHRWGEERDKEKEKCRERRQAQLLAVLRVPQPTPGF